MLCIIYIVDDVMMVICCLDAGGGGVVVVAFLFPLSLRPCREVTKIVFVDTSDTNFVAKIVNNLNAFMLQV